MGRSVTTTIYDRTEAFKDVGMYVADKKNKIAMCSHCSCVINWRKKSVVENHFKSSSHKEKQAKREADNQKQKQSSIITSMSEAGKLKDVKDTLNRSLLQACLKANIPIHKLSNPDFRKWLVENVKGGGDIVSSYWMRKKYMPEIKEEYDTNIKAMLVDKDIVVMCDESTNRKGEAAFITMFKILPTESNASPILVVPSVDILESCSGDTTSKAIFKVLNKFDILYERVVAISSDSAPYMIKCVRLLKELTNPNIIHITCWDHKLDKVSKVYSDKLTRLNDCVRKCKKLFKNTRKRKNNYRDFLKKKYHFSKAKAVKLFPLPVMSRWGSWKVSVVYLSEYLEDVTEYAKTLPEDVVSVKYFKSLKQEDLQILKAEAMFVKDYCGPVDEVMLLLEGSKYPTAHRLYSMVNELLTHFKILKSATDVKSAVPKDTKNALKEIVSRSKCQNVMSRFVSVGTECYTRLQSFLSEDSAQSFFSACEALFSPSKMLILKSMDDSEVSNYVSKHMQNIPFFNLIPVSNFVVLHSLLVDKVSDALQKNIKKDRDFCVVHDMIISMKPNHSNFTEACLKAIFFPTSNTDVERAFSSYNDIVSARRCRLLEGNAEIMTCLYLNNDDDGCEFPSDNTM